MVFLEVDFFEEEYVLEEDFDFVFEDDNVLVVEEFLVFVDEDEDVIMKLIVK